MRKWEGYLHGVDLGGWLSQCDHTVETYENFIKESDFELIRSWGLDHVRIPVDYEVAEDHTEYIDRAIGWCEKYGLNMILDLHKTRGFSFDIGEGEEGFFASEKYQECFYALWEKLAKFYGNIGERVAFELLNEVTDKSYCEPWNEISIKCVKRIRKIAPSVKIVIGGYHNNSIEAVKDLAMPYDENIIYTFHCYEPLIFTHQGAYWAPGMDTSFRMPLDTTYGEMEEFSKKYLSQITVGFSGFDKEDKLSAKYFEEHFAEVVKISEERNVPIYCGEYGVINLASAQDTLKWYSYISAAFNKFGIGRAAWNFREKDFGFVDEHMKDVLPEIIKYL
ncbi:MAG: cellulase family glycosylhydrolase [Lachnospiraceae bacterium]|nr:cellulase family glycosylhydrolase [Lachnospiraceae bacterium]